jgi:hypothetical protein
MIAGIESPLDRLSQPRKKPRKSRKDPPPGVETPVVIQGNKTGNLYVLERETGRPIFGVEERSSPEK